MIIVQSMGECKIDLVEFENLRKWIEYTPKCYIEKLKSGNLEESKLKDDLTLYKIKKLYSLIKRIDGKIDLENRKFHLKNPHSIQEDREYKKLVNSLPKFDIYYYAATKLTDDERNFAYNFMKKCNKTNSKKMMEFAQKYPNFFVSSYLVYLLIQHPESDYIHSKKNIYINAQKSAKRLDVRLKKVRRKEINAWNNANHKIK